MLVTANGDNKKCEKNWLKKLGELKEFLRKSKGSYEGMQKKEPGLYYWYNRCHKARAHYAFAALHPGRIAKIDQLFALARVVYPNE